LPVKKNLNKIFFKKISNFLACNTATHECPQKNFSPICPAVWPAIDNIYMHVLFDYIVLLCSPYSPYYVTRTSANGSAVYWSRNFRIYHVSYYSPFYFSFTVPLRSSYLMSFWSFFSLILFCYSLSTIYIIKQDINIYIYICCV